MFDSENVPDDPGKTLHGQKPSSPLERVSLDELLPNAGSMSRAESSDGFPGDSEKKRWLAEPKKPQIMFTYSTSRLIWFVTMVCLMLGTYRMVPHFIEGVSYSMARGQDRAKYEGAKEILKGSSLESLSVASELICNRVGPSVVHINVEARSVGDLIPSGWGKLHRFQMPSGTGSGVIVDDLGFIVTNYHVVRGAQQIDVSLSDGRKRTAKLIGVDEPTDLAVLKIEADGLIAADWGDSDDLRVGSLVWAVGSPFGLDRSVTMGIVSAKHRAGLIGSPYQDFLQTDAAINPGNSGGPLLNHDGHIVGVNTAIVGESYQGVGFAVPSSVVREVYERIRLSGKVARGWLGVKMGEVSSETANRLGLSATDGVFVLSLVDNAPSPAADAGIQAGDVILRWNENTVKDPTALSTFVAKTKVGSKAQILVRRGTEERTLEVVVGERPDELLNP